MCPPYPQRDRKRRLNGAVCRNHRIKRLVPCRCLDGHVKEPYEMSMAWEPDRRSNFFFSPPAHLCAVTYMTEISLIVTLNTQFTFTFKKKRKKRDSDGDTEGESSQDDEVNNNIMRTTRLIIT